MARDNYIPKLISILLILTYSGGFAVLGRTFPPVHVIHQQAHNSCINCESGWMLEDSTGLNIQQIFSDAWQEFRPNWMQWPHNEHPKNAYWQVFAFTLGENVDSEWSVQFVDPHIDELDVWISPWPKEPSHELASGFGRTFGTRTTQHKNHLIPLDFTKADTLVLIARSKAHLTTTFQAFLNNNSNLISYAVDEYYLLGIFYGIMALLMIYSLSLYFFNKDKTYLFYVLYVLGCSLMAFNEDGIGFQMLWPDFPAFNAWLSDWGPLVFVTTYVLFADQLLQLKTNFKPGRKAMYLSYAIGVGYFFITRAPSIVSPFFLLPFIVTFVVAIILQRRGNRQAKFFVIGYTFILFSQVIYVLRIAGHMIQLPLPWEIFIVYCFNFCAVAEVIILSLGMADRLKEKNEKQVLAQKRVIEQLKANEILKDKVNRELEDKVKARTALLESQKQEIADQAQEISRINQELKTHNTQIQKDRVLFKALTKQEFLETFNTETICYEHLAQLKWANGYTCQKCGHDKYTEGRAIASRRCSSCSTEESPTVRTLFHGMHISIQSAFFMTYLILRNPKVSIAELVEAGKISRPSASSFKRKILDKRAALKKSGSGDLDEFITVTMG